MTAPTRPTTATSSERTIVVWFPDFPLVAARMAYADTLAPDAPMAIADHRGIRAADPAARAEGVRTGMKRRQAQSLCPTLRIVPADEERDARYFEEILPDIDRISAGIDVLRPGLIALRAAPLARYYNSEEEALVKLLDTASRPGVDIVAGIADTLPAAVLAARRGRIIAPGGDAAFLSSLPNSALCEEESLGAPVEMVRTLESLGLHSIHEWAQLPRTMVAARFGADGIHWWDIVHGRSTRHHATAHQNNDFAITYRPEEPINNTDQIAFLGRQLAAQLHTQLVNAHLMCQRLSIRAVIRYGATTSECERTWRSSEPLTESDIAYRLRWQIDAWLHASARAAARTAQRATSPTLDPLMAAGGEDGEQEAHVAAGLIELTLEPTETATHTRRGLWDSTDTAAAQQAIARVQAMIGPDKVCTPVPRGGRGPSDTTLLVPCGEEAPADTTITGPRTSRNATTTPGEKRAGASPAAYPTTAWRGQMPAPLPAAAIPNTLHVPACTVQAREHHPGPNHPAAGVQVHDAEGTPVIVTGRSQLSAVPSSMTWGGNTYEVTAWAGPWPVDEAWWAEGKRFARLQIVTDEPCAMLLICKDSRWRIEGIYR